MMETNETKKAEGAERERREGGEGGMGCKSLLIVPRYYSQSSSLSGMERQNSFFFASSSFLFMLVLCSSSSSGGWWCDGAHDGPVHYFTFNGNSRHVGIRPAAAGGGFSMAPGLSYAHYRQSCPEASRIVAQGVKQHLRRNPSDAAGIIRFFFHDCFVQGCDASLLLEEPFSELSVPPNVNSLRASSLKILNDIKERLEFVCPQVVSCADTLALAAREAIYLVGGPFISMPTGRKDSRMSAPKTEVMEGLPKPTDGFPALKKSFRNHGLNIKDLVALSGAHTIGQAHCGTVDSQVISQVQHDINRGYLSNISKVCLPMSSKSNDTIHMNFLSRDRFDNSYFKNVMAKRALFHSDASLMDHQTSRSLVALYALNQKAFFAQFSISMLKMGQIRILSGNRGEIRRNCSIAN